MNFGQIKKITTLLTVGILVVAMSACSTTPKDKAGTNLEDGTGVTSSGMGEEGSFEGQGPGSITYTTKAPHNQIYYFDYDDNTVHPEYIPSVKAQANYLLNHPEARILLTGNTDERGSREYNIALGERRAKSVLDVIRLAGVSASQVRVVSYGKERPAATGHDESAWKINRRVELTYEAK